jgi:hypothetical protein
VSEPRLTISPAPGITPEQARDARARAWAFIFQCHAKKNAAGVTSTNGDDAMKGPLTHEDRAFPNYTGP